MPQCLAAEWKRACEMRRPGTRNGPFGDATRPVWECQTGLAVNRHSRCKDSLPPLGLPLHVGAALRLGDEPHAGEHERDGHGVARAEHAEAGHDADHHRHHGLQVVVDAHDGGPERALARHHEYVTEESAYHDDVGRLQPCRGRRGGQVNVGEPPGGEGQHGGRGEGEHPLVDGEHRVALHERAEQGQVEREGELGEEAEQVAAEVPLL